MSRQDRLERLTNLVLVLLDASQPLTLQEITDRVEGYPDKKEAIRQAFERDKRALRELGIPIGNVQIPGSKQQIGYVLDPNEYYLGDLDLDDDEAKALGFAVAAVHLGGSAGRDALSTLGLGLLPGAGPWAAPVAVLPDLPALSTIHEALRKRALLYFRYHGRQREVEPNGLAFRNAAWYVVARDRSGSSGRRTFRVDRFESEPQLGEADAFEVPDDLDLSTEIRLLPFSAAPGSTEETGDEEVLPVAELDVDARLSRSVARIVPRGAVQGFAADGSARIHLAVGDLAAFVSFAAGLGDTCVVLGPPKLRDAVIARLQEMAKEPPADEPASEPREPGEPREPSEPLDAPEAPGDLGGPLDEGGASPESRIEPRRARPSGVVAGKRLQRLLAVLVHLSRVKQAAISDLASRFEMDESELVHDLELAACCGVPPYTPDQLIELIVDGDRVTAFGLGHLAKPRRLTAEEGFALMAAGEALCAVEGAFEETALVSALSKLKRALGDSRLSVEVGQPPFLQAISQAASEHAEVRIVYVSSGKSEPTTRTIDPYQVVLREGRWYVDAWCHLARDLRRFQVDRIQAVERTGTCFEPPLHLDKALGGANAFVGGPDSRRVRIAFPAGSELGVEQVAAAPLVQLDDGRLCTDLLVADVEGWLGRLLLRLGPGTEVLSPPELRAATRTAAISALGRYGK